MSDEESMINPRKCCQCGKVFDSVGDLINFCEECEQDGGENNE